MATIREKKYSYEYAPKTSLLSKPSDSQKSIIQDAEDGPLAKFYDYDESGNYFTFNTRDFEAHKKDIAEWVKIHPEFDIEKGTFEAMYGDKEDYDPEFIKYPNDKYIYVLTDWTEFNDKLETKPYTYEPKDNEIILVDMNLDENKLKEQVNTKSPLDYIEDKLKDNGIDYTVEQAMDDRPYDTWVTINDGQDSLADEIICSVVGYAYEWVRDKYGNRKYCKVVTDEDTINELNESLKGNHSFKGLTKKVVEAKETCSQDYLRYKKQLQKAKSIDELRKVWQTIKKDLDDDMSFEEDKKLSDLFLERKKELKENLQEGVAGEFPEKSKLIKALDIFNRNGDKAKVGNWRIAKGDYGLDFEILYKDESVLDGVHNRNGKTDLVLNKTKYGEDKQFFIGPVARFVCQVYPDCEIVNELDAPIDDERSDEQKFKDKFHRPKGNRKEVSKQNIINVLKNLGYVLNTDYKIDKDCAGSWYVHLKNFSNNFVDNMDDIKNKIESLGYHFYYRPDDLYPDVEITTDAWSYKEELNQQEQNKNLVAKITTNKSVSNLHEDYDEDDEYDNIRYKVYDASTGEFFEEIGYSIFENDGYDTDEDIIKNLTHYSREWYDCNRLVIEKVEYDDNNKQISSKFIYGKLPKKDKGNFLGVIECKYEGDDEIYKTEYTDRAKMLDWFFNETSRWNRDEYDYIVMKEVKVDKNGKKRYHKIDQYVSDHYNDGYLENLKEEWKPFGGRAADINSSVGKFDYDFFDEIADDLAKGKTKGLISTPNKKYNTGWELTINDCKKSDFKCKEFYNYLVSVIVDWVRHKKAYQFMIWVSIPPKIYSSFNRAYFKHDLKQMLQYDEYSFKGLFADIDDGDEILCDYDIFISYDLNIDLDYYEKIVNREKNDGKNENLKESWIQFTFEDGSNPYVAKTKEEQDRMFKKYKGRVEQVSDITYLVKSEKKKTNESFDDEKVKYAVVYRNRWDDSLIDAKVYDEYSGASALYHSELAKRSLDPNIEIDIEEVTPESSLWEESLQEDKQVTYVWKKDGDDHILTKKGNNKALITLSRMNNSFPWTIYKGNKEITLDNDSDKLSDIKAYILKNVDKILCGKVNEADDRYFSTKPNNDIKIKKFVREYADEIKDDIDNDTYDEYGMWSKYLDMFVTDFPKNKLTTSEFAIKFFDEINKKFGTDFHYGYLKEDKNNAFEWAMSQIKNARSLYDLYKVDEIVSKSNDLTPKEVSKLRHEISCHKSEMWTNQGKDR